MRGLAHPMAAVEQDGEMMAVRGDKLSKSEVLHNCSLGK